MSNSIALDRTDFEILALLQKDARLSNKEVAGAVGLAQSSVHERLRKLKTSKVLRGAHADVDPKAMGVSLEALFMIGLSKHERGVVDRFIQEISEISEVRSVLLVTGRYDLVVHVVVRDTQHLKDLALDQFTHRAAVTRIETSIIFEARYRHVLPLFADVS